MSRLFRMAAAACCLTVAIAAVAVNPYPTLEAKAARFFDNAEWASAAAIYDLMLEERPAVARTYCQAIVANGMRGEQSEQTRLMERAIDNHIPFDTVFSGVRQWSYHIGHPELFESFLIDTRAANPWMQRTINGYLLKYYTMRNNGPAMVSYSRIMLEGAPDNIPFMTALSEGQMLTGDTGAAMSTYRKILSADAGNYNALLTLGNWYARHPDSAASHHTTALSFLERAYSLRPTPYVAQLIKKLSAPEK